MKLLFLDSPLSYVTNKPEAKLGFLTYIQAILMTDKITFNGLSAQFILKPFLTLVLKLPSPIQTSLQYP